MGTSWRAERMNTSSQGATRRRRLIVHSLVVRHTLDWATLAVFCLCCFLWGALHYGSQAYIGFFWCFYVRDYDLSNKYLCTIYVQYVSSDFTSRGKNRILSYPYNVQFVVNITQWRYSLCSKTLFGATLSIQNQHSLTFVAVRISSGPFLFSLQHFEIVSWPALCPPTGLHYWFQGSLGSASPETWVCREHLFPLQGSFSSTLDSTQSKSLL